MPEARLQRTRANYAGTTLGGPAAILAFIQELNLKMMRAREADQTTSRLETSDA